MAGPDRHASASTSSRRRDRKGQPPRPPNAWILYRSYKFNVIRGGERISQANVSKVISVLWKNESEEVKRYFERMADDRKAEHQQLYPDYRFSPRRKVRAKKQGHRTKKSKARDATPADADAGASASANVGLDVDADAPAVMLAPLPVRYMPCAVPGQPILVMPPPYMIQYSLERYGPGGPSPPISAAPSPAPYESSESPETQHLTQENVASSSSGSSVSLSPSSGSRASSSSSQLPPSSSCFSSLPGSHQPSPNTYAPQPLPTLLFRTSPSNELPVASPQVRLNSAQNAIAGVPVFPARPSSVNALNLQEVVHFDIPISQAHSLAQFSQSFHGSSSSQEVLPGIEHGDAFHVPQQFEASDLLAQPQGNLDVIMGPQASTVDYNQQLFADFDFAEFQQQMDSFAEPGPSSATVTPSVEEDLQALFHASHNPGAQAYATSQQRQPSAFTQDMMRFFDFEAAEGSSTREDAPTVSSASVLAAFASQQVRFQTDQDTAAMPIFTQMTNTATAAPPGTPYVPPAGAAHSSMRRVAASWKASFDVHSLAEEEPVRSWIHSMN